MDEKKKLRVGIIGAGNISEFHMRALSRVAGATVVAIVDSDLNRAEILACKWSVGRRFASTRELFDAGVDVVHVLTPPSAHASLTLEALSRGCHVYVEKPLATRTADCDDIVAAARQSGRSVCVGHSFLRDPTLVRARRIVDSGAIGQPLSIQYVRSTEYPRYRGGPSPEMYRAGGYPFRDMGVHGLYIIESFLGEIGDAEARFAWAGPDPCLFADEWTVLLRTQRGQATIQLSWNSRPQQHSVTIFGTRGVLRADLYAMYVSVKRARRIPGHVLRVVNSVAEAAQMASGTFKGLAGFALGRVRQYHGLQSLVEEFYENLSAGQPAPVTPEQARSVVAWTERIAAPADRAKSEYLAASCQTPTATTLVTGGTGLVGRALVERLLETGRRVRLLVRRIPTDPWLADHPNIELFIGDLGDESIVERAVAGTTSVFHLGAALRGTTEEFDRGTIVGTRNIVDAAQRHAVSKVVYVSSLSVLHALAGDSRSVITEDWPLEPNPQLRGNYSRTKLEAERIVCEAVREEGLSAVILRPAEVLGDGPPRISAGVALKFGKRLIVLGDGRSLVPMIYVGDLVDALLLAERSPIRDGSVFHLVDPAEITQNDLIERFRASTEDDLRVIHAPRWLVRLAGLAGDCFGAITRRRLPISSYRLGSACAVRRFNCDQAAGVLKWMPRVGVSAVLHRGVPESRAPGDSAPDDFDKVPEADVYAKSEAD
jgi:predicted dehydrogenase/nucleoside-diphosphate-sugar epimerase